LNSKESLQLVKNSDCLAYLNKSNQPLYGSLMRRKINDQTWQKLADARRTKKTNSRMITHGRRTAIGGLHTDKQIRMSEVTISFGQPCFSALLRDF